eukprot:CAMPEP_0119124944 /NCGR_PEP_ID=MMETSP1310-20130426/4396_1 /TAXON_ID=464262 /ORGANISM="Genus nov. species nov., Strain RCC2339" /LENGTH=55 /DNA_ID=CAMNT_0007114959 /DNA_START=172 /DNA_END=336 /DNA_ORIENTATION=-
MSAAREVSGQTERGSQRGTRKRRRVERAPPANKQPRRSGGRGEDAERGNDGADPT